MKKSFNAIKELAARGYNKAAIGAGVAASAGFAHAETAIDLSAVTAAIAQGVVAIGTIGVAVLGVRAAVATYSWVRQAIK
ncbi:major capsid protein [Cupriavidus metallidurans]|uniref:major capsid protein n=1 Tax=Cupriavidus metallidurans TaxID=119219 RepID=UPI00049318B5|nr:major capsid protein [Cupriavidus metallidurans]